RVYFCGRRSTKIHPSLFCAGVCRRRGVRVVDGDRTWLHAAVVGVRWALLHADGPARPARARRRGGHALVARERTAAAVLLVVRRPRVGRIRGRVPPMTRLVLALVFVLFALHTADACPICFRDPEAPMTAGVMAGVGTLLSITAGVLGGIGVLI